MPRSEANAKGRSVTLLYGFQFGWFIAKKDNSVSWLDSNGSVYEAGVSISEEEAATFVKAIDCLCARFPNVRTRARTGLALWRYSDRGGDRKEIIVDKEERRILFGRSQDIS